MYTGTVVLAAGHAPHIFTPVQLPTWLNVFIAAMIGVVVFDMWADKIPGVRGVNRLPQILALVSIATAVSSLLDTPLIGSMVARLADLSKSAGLALSATWNIAGWVAVAIASTYFAMRYMNGSTDRHGQKKAERMWPDGIMFGVVVAGLAAVVPTVAYVLELWRFSVVTGVSNLVITVADGVAHWKITTA